MGRQGFFFDLPGLPLQLVVDRTTGAASIANPASVGRDISEYSIGSAGGQLSPGGWQSFQDQSIAGWVETQALPTTLAESTGGGSLSIPSGDSMGIGAAYAGQPIAFGVDAPDDLTFAYAVAGNVHTGDVTYTGESLNNLTLFVDSDTGHARLENTSPFPVSIDAYTIWSPTDSLDPANWISLDQQDADNGQWFEANVDEHRVSELQTEGETFLASGDSFYLGRLYQSLEGQPDLQFEFLIDLRSVAATGLVMYASLGLPGDYNDDGVVDAGDYSIWRDRLGTSTMMPNDMTPGSVMPIDYLVWKFNFGAALDLGGASAFQSVPEPSSVVLVACLVSLHLLRFMARRTADGDLCGGAQCARRATTANCSKYSSGHGQ